jgi:hypothetical protein
MAALPLFITMALVPMHYFHDSRALGLYDAAEVNIAGSNNSAHVTDAYAFATYWATIRCVLKNDPFRAMVYRITSP